MCYSDLAEVAAAAVPDHVRVEFVDDAGHFLQVERPTTVNRLVLDFLS